MTQRILIARIDAQVGPSSPVEAGETHVVPRARHCSFQEKASFFTHRMYDRGQGRLINTAWKAIIHGKPMIENTKHSRPREHVPHFVCAAAATIVMGVLLATIIVCKPWNLWCQKPVRVQTAEADVRAIYDAAVKYHKTVGSWPNSVMDILLLDPRTGKPSPPSLGPHEPKDPWGNYYSLVIANDALWAISYGRDGRPGGDREDADIIYGGPPPVTASQGR